MVLSRFIQQTVNCRCSHWADPILIIDLKRKEVKDQTNIFFWSLKSCQTNEVEFTGDKGDVFCFSTSFSFVVFSMALRYCNWNTKQLRIKPLWNLGLPHVITMPPRKCLCILHVYNSLFLGKYSKFMQHFFWLGDKDGEIICLSCTSLAWSQELNLNQSANTNASDFENILKYESQFFVIRLLTWKPRQILLLSLCSVLWGANTCWQLAALYT